MRISLRLAFIALALAIGGLSSAQNLIPKFALTISVPSTTVVTGTPIEVDISYRNVTNAPLPTRRTRPAEDAYDIEVIGPGGSSPAETPYGQKIHFKNPRDYPSPSYQFVTLSPGQTMDEKIFVDRVYDMSQPGVYTISVSRTIYASTEDWKAHNGVVVKSNTVQVTVTN